MVAQRIARYAREIVPAFNAYLYFRLGYKLARAVARFLYRVRLASSDEAGLRAIAPGSTVVFLMNHRSNMDYVLVAYLAADRTALSYAVGEWARVWPLQSLIRSLGAYFVRRSSGDPLYRRVLERYIHMATQAGVTQAVYPEGGLSRDGRLRPPKLGVLDYMLRGFDPAGERDLVFVPVGINYDRTLEDRTLLLDLEPGTARPGPLAAAATALRFAGHNLRLMLRSRWHRFGYACVNFGTPVSMKRWLGSRGLDLRALSRSSARCTSSASARSSWRRWARWCRWCRWRSSPPSSCAMPASGSGLDLKARAHALLAELEAAGARVYIPRQDQEYAVAAGLRMLAQRRLVVEEDGLWSPRPEELRLLATTATRSPTCCRRPSGSRRRAEHGRLRHAAAVRLPRLGAP